MVDSKTSRFSADLNNLSKIRRFVESAAEIAAVNPDALDDLVLAVDEAATNIIVHGYHRNGGEIEITLRFVDDALTVKLRDDAPGFDPTLEATPDLELPLDERPFGGMGIYLIRKFIDQMIYTFTPEGGNELVLSKNGVRKG